MKIALQNQLQMHRHFRLGDGYSMGISIRSSELIIIHMTQVIRNHTKKYVPKPKPITMIIIIIILMYIIKKKNV